MSQFNNRMDAQRCVLHIVNSSREWKEQLCGLSAKAIDRWALANGLQSDDAVVKSVNAVADRLFFLAAKSQQQVTEEYGNLMADVRRLTDDVRAAVSA